METPETFARRLACPSLAMPMRTGDGWLARLPPLVSMLAPAQLGAIADAAARFGNGLVEISKRGNLQIRGLAAADATALAADLAAAGLALPEGIAVSSDSLWRFSATPTLDPGPIVAALHRRLALTGIGQRLGPKISLVLDCGTPTAPRDLAADLRLAFRDGRVHIGLGGTHESAVWIGAVPEMRAVAVAAQILGSLADRGDEARLAGPRGLAGDDSFLASVAQGITAACPPVGPPPRPPVGPIAGLTRTAWAIAFPFGQAESGALARLAAVATEALLEAFAPAPDRALILAGGESAVVATRAEAARLGFITDSGDPRRFLSACVGSAGCDSGHFPARALAAEAAGPLGALLDGSLDVHFSGCAKGCVHPEAAAFTLSGIDKGAALVLDGRARDAGSGFAAPEKQIERLARLSARVGRQRRPGETARSVVDRIGPAAILSAMTGEAPDEHGGKPT